MEGDVAILSSEMVEKYRTQPEVLDAFLQWSENPTSASAGYGVEENYSFIENNLAIRYNRDAAAKIIPILVKEMNRLTAEAKNDIYLARSSIHEALESSGILEEHVVSICANLPNDERRIVSMLSMLKPPSLMFYNESESLEKTDEGRRLYAYVKAIDVDIPAYRLETMLIKLGLVNKLLWIGAKRYEHIQLVFPYYVGRIASRLSRLSTPPETNRVSELVSKLQSHQAYAELAILDELVQVGGAMRERYDQYGLPSWKGIVGKYEGWMVVTPNLYETLRDEIMKIKVGLMERYEQILAKVMESLRSKYWPKAEFTRYEDDSENAYWRIELGVGRPMLRAVASPWMTPSIARLSGDQSRQLLVFLANQSFPSAESTLYAYGTSSGTTLVAFSDEIIDVKKYPQADPFVDEIIEMFKEFYPKQNQKVTSRNDPEPSLLGEAEREIPSGKSELLSQEGSAERSRSVDENIVGTSREPQQWGILGTTSDGKVVKMDLNAPHIVFICGKMGSGKGYTIGVLSEMLCSKSVPRICNVKKPATIIVLYNPREDKRSEFWSFRYPNDVSEETEKLRERYGIAPLSTIDDNSFRVFVDPFVFEKAGSMFKGDYGTQNVFPMYVDPSSLTGQEWAIVLSAGGRADQLYVKQLFSIIEKRQFEQFDLETIRSDVIRNEKLNATQQNLALQRLEILENYLNVKSDSKDFTHNLAIGGVNIFDFRKTIRTPDDVFSVMTLILSILQTKKGLENEPFVFVINEAHDYFKGGVAQDFVESIEYLIRRKRHGANWLMLDTHFPDDVDEKVIKLADVKMVSFLDVTVKSRILTDAYKGMTDKFSKLHVGQTLISADESSIGKFIPILVDVRPRLTKHGAPTKKAIG